MIRQKDINWYLEEPTRLVQMKPFTRGGNLISHGYENGKVRNNAIMDVGLTTLDLNPISQDTYITEYRPDLHHIILNKSIPHIRVMIDNTELPTNMMDITLTSSYQKLIHAAHVRSLTANPLEFTLLANDAEQGGAPLLDNVKSEWTWRNMDWWIGQAINTCKQLGNCGLLFSFDKETMKYSINCYSYEDGYQIVPNYDEYGTQIACSLVYMVESRKVIDTYDNKYHYRSTTNEKGEWEVQKEVHGFSHCPLLHKRGKVAWEYAESTIEMYELMQNINAIALKRFGTFALVLIGDMDKDSFKRDNSTLVINLSADTTGGKQDAKVLNFPEPTTMQGYLDSLEKQIGINSSTSFITPKDIAKTGSGGNGIALAMSCDLALATQSAGDWKKFVCDAVRLHQEGLDLENNGINKYGKLHVGASIIPWSLETNNTRITNLQMESNWLSTRTIIEKSPDAAPDEIQRIIDERGSLTPRNTNTQQQQQTDEDDDMDDDTKKAFHISRNNNNTIVTNDKKQK